MTIRLLAPWFGSKRRLAPLIAQQLGHHTLYWEPFCGSCAVLLSKKPAPYESVNDLHKDLINLARVVQDESKAKELYGRVSRTLFCEDFARESKERLTEWNGPPDGNVDRAYWYLVFSWFHLHGIAGTPIGYAGTFCVRYSTAGGAKAPMWRSVAESIPDWHERLRNVQILNRDAFTLLEKIEDSYGTSLYIDPPYLNKNDPYCHDFENEDHRRLAETLRRFKKSRVVVSYYDHPLLAELYQGWHQIKCHVVKCLVNPNQSSRRKHEMAPEVLLVNGAVIGGKQQSLFVE